VAGRFAVGIASKPGAQTGSNQGIPCQSVTRPVCRDSDDEWRTAAPGRCWVHERLRLCSTAVGELEVVMPRRTRIEETTSAPVGEGPVVEDGRPAMAAFVGLLLAAVVIVLAVLFFSGTFDDDDSTSPGTGNDPGTSSSTAPSEEPSTEASTETSPSP
jgi:hypothetical protein